MKIAILTDASFDGNIRETKDLFMAPLFIVEEDGTTHENNESFDKEMFYKLLEAQKLKTTLTPPGIMMEIWDRLLKKYDQIIFLPISKGLSGQFSTFRMLSETEEQYNGKVFVCDSNGVSVGNQEMVRRVAKWISENKTGPEIIELARISGENVIGFIVPKSLETLKRGGRISPAAANLAKLFKIVPILKYDGKIDKETTARTFKKAILTASELIKNQSGMEKIDIAYSKMDSETLNLILDIVKSQGLKVRILSEMSPVVTCHTGPETVALLTFKDGLGE